MIPLISPALQRSTMSSRHLRVMLTIFTVRHLLGIGVFAWMTWTAYAAGLPLWWILPAFGSLYIGTVLWNGRKLIVQYRRRLVAEQNTISAPGKAR